MQFCYLYFTVAVYNMFEILSPFTYLFYIQVLFKDGLFQWKRLENLIVLAKENVNKMSTNPALISNSL
jgi:hypothetical protein